VEQVPHKPWNLDWEEDKEGVPYIILDAGCLTGWDYEINQIPWNPYNIEWWEGTERLPEKNIIVPVITIKNIYVRPAISLYVMTDAQFAIQQINTLAVVTISPVTIKPLVMKKLDVSAIVTIKLFTE
jgi:hypothetical protein